jgi:hypothetical protein
MEGASALHNTILSEESLLLYTLIGYTRRFLLLRGWLCFRTRKTTIREEGADSILADHSGQSLMGDWLPKIESCLIVLVV